MSKDEIKGLIVLVAVFALGGVCGFFIGKGIYQPTFDEKVARDTVYVRDTVFDYQPMPVDSSTVRYVTRYLPKFVTDTVVKTDVITCHDSVLVEVPITSKHYQSQDYDAWVSGYEPSLDSIKVYQRTEYITERVTISKPPNKWELDAFASIDYRSRHETYMPSAGIELTYKPSRLQVGVRAGVSRMDKAESFVGAVVRYRIF